jgi:predicted O-linked N-acetylglucosamine transferase (SPINDLY family)
MPDSYLCFSPPLENIEIENLPALANGYITFGCFNNLSKINENVIRVWAEILGRIKNSKIFLKSKQLSDSEVRNRIIHLFEKNGITKDRVILEGFSSRLDYFKAYNRIDIALDPFPFPGGTTSVEGMWMGVPVIAKRGYRFISHNGETIAINSGQSDWLAKDEKDYVAKAIGFATNLNLLSSIRSKLRMQLLSSPLMDAPRFARNFEKNINLMWKNYCEKNI